MEKLSRKQKYQEYRDELKKDNEAFAKSQALNNYQNKIEELQNKFEGGQVNPSPFVDKELPSQEQKVEKAFETKEEAVKEENIAEFQDEYKDLFNLLDETPTVESASQTFEDSVYEKPVKEENTVEDLLKEEPVVEEPVYEEPVEATPVQEEPAVITTPVQEEPIIIDTTQDYFEEETDADISGIDSIIQGIDNYNKQPAEEYVQPDVAEFDNVKPIEPIYEEPVQEEVIEENDPFEELLKEEPVIEKPIIEEPVIEEPVVEPEPVVEEPVVELEPEAPVVEIEEEPEVQEEVPEEKPQEFEPVQEPDGIEIKNIDELDQEEEINATLTDTIPFVIDDEAVKEAIEEYDDEEDDEEAEEVPNKVLNVILVILIIILVIVLGLIVYYILAGQGIIG